MLLGIHFIPLDCDCIFDWDHKVIPILVAYKLKLFSPLGERVREIEASLTADAAAIPRSSDRSMRRKKENDLLLNRIGFTMIQNRERERETGMRYRDCVCTNAREHTLLFLGQ